MVNQFENGLENNIDRKLSKGFEQVILVEV